MDGPPGKIRDRSGGRAGVKCRNAAAPCRQGGGAGHGASRRPRPTGIPAHGTGRPSVPPLQKCRDLSDERRRGRSQTGPRAFARGARIQDVTLIRPFGPPYPFCPSGTFPPIRGKACGRPKAAPTAESGPGALARQSQAQFWNRNNSKFCKPRAQWPGLNSGKPLRFCAPEMLCLAQGVTPVNGVRGRLPLSGGVGPGALCPIPRCSRRSPAKRVRREEEEQGNERSFRRQAETEWSGLKVNWPEGTREGGLGHCDDEPPRAK